MKNQQKCVKELTRLLKLKPDLKNILIESLKKAKHPKAKNLDQFLQFVNDILTNVPTFREMDPAMEQFYDIIDCAPGNGLQKDAKFSKWMDTFAKEWGLFLDTTSSAESLDTFIKDPSYNIGDYQRDASGWLTFNQFFTRKVKPGRRPVAGLCNDKIIVSPADSVYQGCWPIDEHAKVTTKGKSYSVINLLDASKYQSKFKNGIFTHSYLNSNDYHRYHVPVGGKIKEVRLIPGNVMMDMRKKPDGTLESEDDLGFQFNQTRGMMIIETETIGHVAVLPVGMAQVSSVIITAEVGTRLVKGEEFGYFCFGGSDIIMLFEPGKVKLNATIGKHYKQGEKLGDAV